MTENRKEFVRAAYCILGSDAQTLTRKSIQVVLDNYDNLAFPAWVVGKDQYNPSVIFVDYLPKPF